MDGAHFRSDPRLIRIGRRAQGRVAVVTLVRDWERMTISQAVEAGIRACTAARRTDEPRRLMAAFLERKKK